MNEEPDLMVTASYGVNTKILFKAYAVPDFFYISNRLLFYQTLVALTLDYEAIGKTEQYELEAGFNNTREKAYAFRYTLSRDKGKGSDAYRSNRNIINHMYSIIFGF